MAEGQIIVIKDDEKERKYQQGQDEESDDPDYEQVDGRRNCDCDQGRCDEEKIY